MFGYLFNDKKKKRDNLERYDDKRRPDNRGNGGSGGNGEGNDDRLHSDSPQQQKPTASDVYSFSLI